jgi:CO/xanthine dehydrogenase FAD-binding subunit
VLLFGPAGPSARSLEAVLRAGVPEGALITAVRVPVVPGRRSAYVKYGGRHASARATACVAASLRIEGGRAVEPRVAVAGLCRARRLRSVERLLEGRPLDASAIEAAARLAALEAPFEDVDFAPGEEQRRRLVAAGVDRVLMEVCAREG